MIDCLQQGNLITDTLASISAPLEDEDIVLYILNGLPLAYNLFKTVVCTRAQHITLLELHDLLLIEEQQLQTSVIEDQLLSTYYLSYVFSVTNFGSHNTRGCRFDKNKGRWHFHRSKIFC